MKIFNWFKKKEIKESKPKLTIGTLKQYDDVKVLIDDVLYDAWVIDKKHNLVEVTYNDINELPKFIKFRLERPLDRTEITENNITLITEYENR